MPKLKYLWHERYRVASEKKDMLKKKLGHLKINEDGLRIAFPDEIYEPKNGTWEIYCDQSDYP